MIFVTLMALTGSVLNRVRGGLILKDGGTVNEVVFGVVAALSLWAFNPPSLITHNFMNLLTYILCVAAMWLGAQPGWGRYIGALRGDETEPLEEWAPVDILIVWLKPYMRLWGFAGLSLRGMWWGFCLGLPMVVVNFNAWPALCWMTLAGGLMGSVYGLVDIISCLLVPYGDKSWEGDALERAEVAWGAVLWGTWAALVTGV